MDVERRKQVLDVARSKVAERDAALERKAQEVMRVQAELETCQRQLKSAREDVEAGARDGRGAQDRLHASEAALRDAVKRARSAEHQVAEAQAATKRAEAAHNDDRKRFKTSLKAAQEQLREATRRAAGLETQLRDQDAAAGNAAATTSARMLQLEDRVRELHTAVEDAKRQGEAAVADARRHGQAAVAAAEDAARDVQRRLEQRAKDAAAAARQEAGRVKLLHDAELQRVSDDADARCAVAEKRLAEAQHAAQVDADAAGTAAKQQLQAATAAHAEALAALQQQTAERVDAMEARHHDQVKRMQEDHGVALAAARAEVEQLSTLAEQLRTENRDLTQRSADTLQQLRDTRLRLKALQDEARDQVQEAQEGHVAAVERTKALEAQCRQRIRQAKDDAARTVEAVRQKTAEEMATLQEAADATTARLRRQLEEAQAQIAADTRDFASSREELNSRVRTLEVELTETTAAATATENQLRQDLEDAQERVLDLQAALDDARQTHADTLGAITHDNDQQVHTLTAELLATKSALDALRDAHMTHLSLQSGFLAAVASFTTASSPGDLMRASRSAVPAACRAAAVALRLLSEDGTHLVSSVVVYRCACVRGQACSLRLRLISCVGAAFPIVCSVASAARCGRWTRASLRRVSGAPLPFASTETTSRRRRRCLTPQQTPWWSPPRCRLLWWQCRCVCLEATAWASLPPPQRATTTFLWKRKARLLCLLRWPALSYHVGKPSLRSPLTTRLCRARKPVNVSPLRLPMHWRLSTLWTL